MLIRFKFKIFIFKNIFILKSLIIFFFYKYELLIIDFSTYQKYINRKNNNH